MNDREDAPTRRNSRVASLRWVGPALLAAGVASLLSWSQASGGQSDRTDADAVAHEAGARPMPPIGSIPFLDSVRSEGVANLASFGVELSSVAVSDLRSLPAARNEHGTLLVATDDAERVCLVVLLGDWSPTTCGSRTDMATGRVAMAAQSAEGQAHIVAALVPQGGRVVLDGVTQAIENNVWFGAITDGQLLEIYDVGGVSVDLDIG